MRFMVDNEIYEIRYSKKRQYTDEYQIYCNNKFICIFYQDGRPLHDAVDCAVRHVKSHELFKKNLLK